MKTKLSFIYTYCSKAAQKSRLSPLKVQRAVKNAVQNMTGRVVTKVNISIVGVDFSEIAQAQK